MVLPNYSIQVSKSNALPCQLVQGGAPALDSRPELSYLSVEGRLVRSVVRLEGGRRVQEASALGTTLVTRF